LGSDDRTEAGTTCKRNLFNDIARQFFNEVGYGHWIRHGKTRYSQPVCLPCWPRLQPCGAVALDG
jgi:hypothetical protein